MSLQNLDNRNETACSSCSRPFAKDSEEGRISPFDRQLILNHYDGTLTALLRCGACRTIYYARIIDWAQQFDRRIFSLMRLQPDALERAIALYSLIGQEPRWPIWSPMHPLDVENQETLESLFENARDVSALIATDRYIQRILALRVPEIALRDEIQNSSEDGFPAPVRDWFEWLGLHKKMS